MEDIPLMYDDVCPYPRFTYEDIVKLDILPIETAVKLSGCGCGYLLDLFPFGEKIAEYNKRKQERDGETIYRNRRGRFISQEVYESEIEHIMCVAADAEDHLYGLLSQYPIKESDAREIFRNSPQMDEALSNGLGSTLEHAIEFNKAVAKQMATTRQWSHEMRLVMTLLFGYINPFHDPEYDMVKKEYEAAETARGIINELISFPEISIENERRLRAALHICAENIKTVDSQFDTLKEHPMQVWEFMREYREFYFRFRPLIRLLDEMQRRDCALREAEEKDDGDDE